MSHGPSDIRMTALSACLPAAPSPDLPVPVHLSSADQETLAALDRAPKVNAADLPIEKLAANQSLSEADKVAEVGRQFEAILLRQILSEAYKNTFTSTLSPPSAAKDIYQDMITSQLADSISKSGKFGLARSFQKQLTRQIGVAPSPPSDASPVPPTSLSPSPISGPAGVFSTQP
jgi:Rod binding domain-containing protein